MKIVKGLVIGALAALLALTTNSQAAIVYAGNSTSTKVEEVKLGDITQVEDFYIGLAYTRKMDYLPSELGIEKENSNDEFILLFFNALNGGKTKKDFSDLKFLGYADGEEIEVTKTYIRVVTDGVESYGEYTLEAGSAAMAWMVLEVPKDCKEFKVFCNDSVSWEVKSDHVAMEELQDL